VLRDNLRFSSSGYAEVMGAVMGHTILEMDEPEHHAYRSVIQQAFSRKAMEMWEADLVGPVVDELIDRFIDDQRADLVPQLLFPFPVNVIAGLLGLPRADLPQFHRWTVELISVSIDMDKALTASKNLYDYLVEFRASAPGRTGKRHDQRARARRARRSEAHRRRDHRVLPVAAPAGAETTYRSSSNLLTGLLTHPDQLDECVRIARLLPMAIEEGLRGSRRCSQIMRTSVEETQCAASTYRPAR